jgi:hypothetical protein
MVVDSWLASIFRILATEDHGGCHTQKADGRHYSQDRWNAELTF